MPHESHETLIPKILGGVALGFLLTWLDRQGWFAWFPGFMERWAGTLCVASWSVLAVHGGLTLWRRRQRASDPDQGP